MRKVILMAVLLMAVPAMAANVTITCEVGNPPDCNEVTVSYDTDGTLIRAFGLVITCNDPCVAITQVVPVDANYRIYPGQIEIDDGEVTDYSTPYASDDLGDANVAIEMGSLYTTDSNYETDPNAGYNMIPGSSGVLLKFYVDDPNGTFDVNEDPITGGVVLEDPCEAVVVTSEGGDFSDCEEPPKCMAETNPDYTMWVGDGYPWSEPNCWCYERQCRGDGNGTWQGPFPVGSYDLDDFRLAFNVHFSQMDNTKICSDYNHTWQGPFPVGSYDLDILRQYLNTHFSQVPSCGSPPDPNFNYWIVP